MIVPSRRLVELTEREIDLILALRRAEAEMPHCLISIKINRDGTHQLFIATVQHRSRLRDRAEFAEFYGNSEFSE